MPRLNRAMVSAVVAAKVADARRRHPEQPLPRVLLLWGSYPAEAEPQFQVRLSGSDDRPNTVRVRDEHSVLGVVDAVHQHVATAGEDLLVVTTDLALAPELDWDVRGYVFGHDVQSVEPSQVIGQRFSATEVDPRLRRERWLVDALLEAEPAEGWPPIGAVLSHETAIRTLVVRRLDLEAAGTDSLDVLALLDWAEGAGPERYRRLGEDERLKIRAWLCERIGVGADAVLSLIEQGKADDLSALGLLCSVSQNRDAGVSLALLFKDVVRKPAELAALWSVVNGRLTRWSAQIESQPGATNSLRLRRRLDAVVARADQLAAEYDLLPLLTGHRWLMSAWKHDFRSLAKALDAVSDDNSIGPVSAALKQVADHGLARLLPGRTAAARDAVRLARWLTAPIELPRSVADALHRHSNDWGWVDRALNLLWAPDTGGDPVVSATYGRIYQRARQRRDEIDRSAADLLRAWTPAAISPTTAGALVVEDVLAQTAVALTGDQQPPLIIVLDGMSSAVAVELAEQAARDGWFETSPKPHRISAISVLPSVTRLSRTSLLTGTLGRGDQRTESEGFTTFWRTHHRGAQLFHKGDLPGGPGHRFSEPVRAALLSDDVVGVVLNTIDDALDHGREGIGSGWSVRDVTYLGDLLNAAREGARPVLLVADHGHVLDRTFQDDPNAPEAGDTSARWRTGSEPREGEVEVSGPRVLEGGGRVILPWRESIRYSRRKAGYHGGAALAEITVPIIALLPTREQAPPDWHVLSPESVVPAWWSARQAPSVPVSKPAATKSSKAPRKPAGPPQEALFGEPEAPVEVPSPASSLGQDVVASGQYRLTRSQVRKPPAPTEVAAVIDALIAADGTLSVSAVATAAGRGGRNPAGLVSTLQRLLNVEGYPVLGLVDAGQSVRLDVALLREQFELPA